MVAFVGNILRGKVRGREILTNQSPFVKIHQTFPPSKFCAIRYVVKG